MQPGSFAGILSTDWINKDWERVHQCGSRRPQWSYTTAGGIEIVPPDGFITDLGSIPRLFQNIIRRDELKPAFIIHDYLYDTQRVKRSVADLILREAIYTLTGGYSPIRSACIYWAVRMFGGFAWKKDCNRNLVTLSLRKKV